MTPIRLSHSWSRRVYVGLFSVALSYAVLFLLQFLGVVPASEAFQINLFTAIGGALVAIASAVLFFMVDKVSSFIPALATFLVLALSTAFLAQQTGGVGSAFLAPWTLIVFFAPLFGAYGWVPIIVMAGSYAAGAYLANDFSAQMVVLLALSTAVPVVAGSIIWRDTGAEDASEKNVKNLASQLSEVATKSEIIINAIGDGVIALDGQGVIQLINPAAQEILGWGKQDALMLNYKSILKLTDENNAELTTAQDPVQQVLNTNQQARGSKLTVTTQSGRKLGISLVVSPIGDLGSGVIAVFRDVTKERAEEREQAEFISTASHEMRTPVASIEGYLGLALNPNTATVDQRGHDFIMKAQEAAQHLGRLFQDLLDVSQSEDGRMASEPKVVDIVQYAQTIAEGLTPKAAEKGLEVIFVPTQDRAQKKIMPVYHVNQDNDHIREVLDNLIENAIKYTPKGTILIDVTGTDDKVVISVKDSGLGIPAEDLSHLFQKFYRVNNADRQDIGGTGLGLYLSRRLAESMQGRLWAESVFGQGSTFFLELPRISSTDAERLKNEQAIAAQTPPTTSIPVTFADTPGAPAPTGVAPQAQAQPQPLPAQDTPGPAAPAITAPEATAAPVAPTSAPPQPIPSQPQPTTVQPAKHVPRGESLTNEQKAERVRQLEALAQQQRQSTVEQPRGAVTPPPRSE